ncbi:hypothetical protein ACLESO_58390, partial [Pyxidicoccus sp. 3LG]
MSPLTAGARSTPAQAGAVKVTGACPSSVTSTEATRDGSAATGRTASSVPSSTSNGSSSASSAGPVPPSTSVTVRCERATLPARSRTRSVTCAEAPVSGRSTEAGSALSSTSTTRPSTSSSAVYAL